MKKHIFQVKNAIKPRSSFAFFILNKLDVKQMIGSLL